MGAFLVHLVVVLISCTAVVYKPSIGLEFFRNLLVLSTGIGYDFWSTYLIRTQENNQIGQGINLIGVIFFIIEFIISVFGLFNILEIDFNQEPHMIKTSNLIIFDWDIINLNFITQLTMGLPAGLLVADQWQKKIKERRDKK